MDQTARVVARHRASPFLIGTLRSAPAVAATALLLGVGPARAVEHDMSVFVQAGEGDRPVWSEAIGLTRDFRSKERAAQSDSHWSAYGEFTLGRWRTRSDDGEPGRSYTRVGLTPSFRYAFGESRLWYFDFGVGVNAIAPKYHVEGKRFSTVFNFGDHLSLGRRFGSDRENELGLRFEHFSNGGIKQPNPGQNFIQVRYARHF